MCNLFQNTTYGWGDWEDAFSELRIPLRMPDPLPNVPEELRPTDPAPMFRPLDAAGPTEGMSASVARWDLVPSFWRQPIKSKFLATNARSETIATTAAFKEAFARRRCLVPADGFFEWTGQKGAKTRWRFTPTDQPWFCFAGIWDHAETADGPLDSFALLTTAAGADMEPYHNRQPVILSRANWLSWLDLSGDPRPLFEASPAGALKVELAPATPTKSSMKQPKLDGLF